MIDSFPGVVVVDCREWMGSVATSSPGDCEFGSSSGIRSLSIPSRGLDTGTVTFAYPIRLRKLVQIVVTKRLLHGCFPKPFPALITRIYPSTPPKKWEQWEHLIFFIKNKYLLKYLVGTGWEHDGNRWEQLWEDLREPESVFPLCSHYVPTMFPLLFLFKFMFFIIKSVFVPTVPTFRAVCRFFFAAAPGSDSFPSRMIDSFPGVVVVDCREWMGSVATSSPGDCEFGSSSGIRSLSIPSRGLDTGTVTFAYPIRLRKLVQIVVTKRLLHGCFPKPFPALITRIYPSTPPKKWEQWEHLIFFIKNKYLLKYLVGTGWEHDGNRWEQLWEDLREPESVFPLCSHYVPTMFPLCSHYVPANLFSQLFV